MKNYFLYIITLLLGITSFGQQKDKFLPKGNEAFLAKKYAEAEVDYRKSQAAISENAKASYNLGTTIYKQNQSAEAKTQFLKAAQNAKTKEQKHRAFHNLGNTLMNDKNYEAAAEAYKNALRNNPADEETRYNYALAKKKNDENPKSKDDKKKDNKDQKEEKKDENKDEQEKKENQEQNKPKQQPQNQQPQGQPKPDDVSKQKIENLLNAVNNEEKKVQDKVKGKQIQAPSKNEKDW
ncbi:MAG: tetratricopeptide (TPR) repeat protein [Flavobacterium sp.]|jgi:tetratricopeptide (TPR) repeat protein